MLHIHVTKQEMQHGQVSANASIVTPHSAHVLLRWEALCHIFGSRTPDENDFQKPVPQEKTHHTWRQVLCYVSTGMDQLEKEIDHYTLTAIKRKVNTC